MPTINWSDDLNIGIESIDEQHRHIINLLNELNEVHKNGDINRSNELLSGLIEYKLSHCAFEEALLKESKFPFFKMHRESHALIINKSLALHQCAENGEYILNEAIPFLKTSLLRHMKGEDADYAAYMRLSQHNKNKLGLGWLGSLKRLFK